MIGKRTARHWPAPLVTALALTACVGLFAGSASAKYFPDGATPNGVTGGWNLPTDFVCIVGVHADGTLDIASGITDRHACQYYTTGLTGLTMVDVTSSTMCGSSGGLACNSSTNCTGTNTTTKGTLTWNSGDAKCYDSAACTVAGFASGTYGGISFSVSNDGAKHSLATSICVDGSGNGVYLSDLDRTAQMCAQKGGTWKQTSSSAPFGVSGTFPSPGFGGSCVAFGAQFKGQNASGTPYAFGSKGVDLSVSAGAGYCYAAMNFTAVYPTANCPSLMVNGKTCVGGTNNGLACSVVGDCPSGACNFTGYNAAAAYDWSIGSSQCRYAKGIAGKLQSALTKANGTTYASGAYIDLSTYTTMGDCLANGGTWNAWVGTATTVTVTGTDSNSYKRPGWDYTNQTPDADAGCLHCHSTTVQYNGPAERFKDSYLKTGHKNMLRKVVAGQSWAGPDGLIYTVDTVGHAINFLTGQVNGGPLYFIFGDWLAPAPNTIGPNGDTTSYSCGACHTTGFNDSTNPGVQSIATAGYVAQQPQAPYDSNVAAGHKWDIEGITCARCHNATVPPVSQGAISGGSCDSNHDPELNITNALCTAAGGTWTAFGTASASAFASTHPTSGGMGSLADGTGRTNLCFGCHQSIAKKWPAQGGSSGGDTQYDPTLIPTGVSHGAAAGRDFNGHVIGNSFLNSVHGEYAGVNSNTAAGGIRLNALGKYDLVDPSGASEYGSAFTGFTCWQSSSSSSPAKTWIDSTITTQAACEAAGGELSAGKCVREIKDKTKCESIYGAGAWRADDGSGLARSTQGTCVTCHDVHNSVVDAAGQKEAAIRKKCQDCHVNNATTGATDASAPQIVVANIGHPMGGGTPFDTSKYDNACVVCHMATQAEANGNQNSMPAHLWRISTDPDYSTFPTTGQFYGGTCSVHTGAVQNAPSLPVVYLSDTSSANCIAASGTWTAVTKDRNAQTAPDSDYTKAVWVDLDLACGQCHGGSLGADNVANNAPHIAKADLAVYAANIHNNAPQVNFGYALGNPNTLMVTVFAQASCTGSCSPYDWDWGDGSAHGSGVTATHTYSTGGTYAVTLSVQGGAGSSTKNVSVYTPDGAPTASGINCATLQTLVNTNWAATFTDSSSDDSAVVLVTVNWGDGAMLATGAQGMTFGPHTYGGPGTYTVTHKALDTIGQQRIETCAVTVSYLTISGTVEDSTSAPLASAAVVVTDTLTSVVVGTVYTAVDGTFSAGSLRPGTYQLTVTKSGYTFALPAAVIPVGPSSMGNVIMATADPPAAPLIARAARVTARPAARAHRSARARANR